MVYIPTLPFEAYKWYFATKAPTEALGDPAVLLGLVTRMANIANGETRYNSPEFTKVLSELDEDINTTVNLPGRGGERNIMRNSGQYWKLFKLIPQNTRGLVVLTDLAKGVASGEISQMDFSASMIITMTLPNAVSYSEEEIKQWEYADLSIHPLKIILQVVRELFLTEGSAYLTVEELAKVVVPMVGDKQQVNRIARYVLRYRQDNSIIAEWPDCTPRSNDKRYLGEFLRFLANYGYLVSENLDYRRGVSAANTRYSYIPELDYQIAELLDGNWSPKMRQLLGEIRKSGLSETVTMAGIARQGARPGQQKFRADVLKAIRRCPITGCDLPAVLQAAHIRPYRYAGSQTVDNGLPLRADIHCLFDAGLLSLQPTEHDHLCRIELTDKSVRLNYREYVDKIISMPSITSMECVRWRYENRFLGIL